MTAPPRPDPSAPATTWNPWPWVAPAVLLVMALANAVLIYLAVTTDDRLIEVEPVHAEPAP